MNTSVAVLGGGWSSERDVSLMGSKNIAAALRDAGYDVREIDVGRNMSSLIRALTPPPDIVYNALHGPYGEDGCIQGILECLGIRYTHSGVLASALAMDKPMAKVLFETAGIPCPKHRVVSREAFDAGERVDFPFVIKPLNEGSSFGVHIIRAENDISALGDQIWTYGKHIMLETFIEGRELTVAVLGDKALAVTEIQSLGGFYDYEAKYTADRAKHLIPAPVHSEAYSSAMDYAVRAHEALGCRGVSRADLIYDDRAGEPGNLFLLEVNTQPGMTPFSLVPEQAAHAGMEFNELVSWMVENASCDG